MRSEIIDNLDKLNRKERFFLIGDALWNPTFKLGPEFRQKLSQEFSLPKIPEDAFVAMDYHLNWIFGAMSLAFSARTPPIYDNPKQENGQQKVDGTQEDIDLLVAFDDPSRKVHLIMIEAKCFESFSNAPFMRKMDRLKQIFGERGDDFPDVRPHFGIMSPRRPEKLDLTGCPAGLLTRGHVPWIKLEVPAKLRLFRCDKLGGEKEDGGYWTVKPQPGSGPTASLQP